MQAPRVVAVVVSYQPDVSQLHALLAALVVQVNDIVIVDNGSRVDVKGWVLERYPGLQVIALGDNLGIATAQNVGIDYARKVDATHVLLMDQDSVPPAGMVKALADALLSRPKAAAAGPRYYDIRQGAAAPFIRLDGLALQRLHCDDDACIVAADYLIASGCLIPMAVLDQVGGMRDDLFIDYVDIEWGMRAKHHGFQSYGVCSTQMHHQLGDPPVRFLGKLLPMHSPLRHYYHVRNAVLLYREGWVPLNWKLVDAWRLLLKFGFYSTVPPERLRHLRMMSQGVWHGVRGRAGARTSD